MKKFQIRNKLENGQIIPLVVVMFIVIIGMVALIIDGGAVMSNRRTAQAAADAGALAGAQRACLGKDDAVLEAERYATINGATTALATVIGKQVTVNATVEHPSYFAKIFGDPTLEASAEATAGCFGVKGKGVVPVGWKCLPNNTGGPFDTAYGCQMQTLSWNKIGPLVTRASVVPVPIPGSNGVIKNYEMMSDTSTSIISIEDGSDNVPPEQIYILFDGQKCSIDSCGYNGGGNRGYLYPPGVKNNIKNWIEANGPHPVITIKTHIWLSDKPGEDVAIIKAMVDTEFPGQVVMVPVYNYYCPGNNNQGSTTCQNGAHDPTKWPIFNGVDDLTTGENYHIIAFAPFYVSCIDKKGANCPGSKHAAINLNKPVIEGYFLSDYDVSPDFTDDCSINLGNCTVSLTK